MRYTITITRQFGSYGGPIGQDIAKELGIKYYDSSLLTEEWLNENLPESLIEENKKMRAKEALTPFEKLMSTSYLNKWDESENRFQELSNIIRYLCEKESAVFVGRMSDYLLDDLDNVIRIYIYAPFDTRVNAYMQENNCPVEEAKKKIVEMDDSMNFKHKQHCGYYPYDVNHQDILIDSSLLGKDKTAKFLVKLIEEKFSLFHL